MGYPLWDMLDDLAIARGLRGAQADSDGSYLRGRIAAVLWIPGLAVALIVGGWNNSLALGLLVIALTLVVMALVAWGPRRLVGGLRRRLSKQP
jgi:hypothetical protein